MTFTIGTPRHGDIIMFDGYRCVVSIRGIDYRTMWTHRYENITKSDRGFLLNIDIPNSVPQRAIWGNEAQIVSRKFPSLK